MTVTTIITLYSMSDAFAHNQLVLGKNRSVWLPLVCAVELNFPLLEPTDQSSQGCFITIPAFPVKELACIAIHSLPDPEFPPFFFR